MGRSPRCRPFSEIEPSRVRSSTQPTLCPFLTMKILFFQNWSVLGVPLAEALMKVAIDEMMLVGPDVPSLFRDPQLIAEAKRHRVPLLLADDLLEPNFFAKIEAFAPDLLVVATYPKKVPNRLLQLPRLAAINLHPAYLPRYRGACPEFWVLRNGEKTTGVTFHHMTERFDAGHILAQAEIPVLPDDNLLTLTERMLQPAWDLLVQLLEAYRRGERPAGAPQDPALVTKAPMVRPEHLKVNWNEAADGIERLVRAAQPAYAAQTPFRSLELTLKRVAVAPPCSPVPAPGQLLVFPERRSLLAGTGDGLLELQEVQATYAPTMDGWTFVQAYGINAGEVLGRGNPRSDGLS